MRSLNSTIHQDDRESDVQDENGMDCKKASSENDQKLYYTQKLEAIKTTTMSSSSRSQSHKKQSVAERDNYSVSDSSDAYHRSLNSLPLLIYSDFLCIQ